MQIVGVVGEVQGWAAVVVRGRGEKRPDGYAVGAKRLHPASHPVELSKFTQGLSGFAALFHAGLLVVLAPFQLTFDTVDLQFLL
jgi:hypothetical protein